MEVGPTVTKRSLFWLLQIGETRGDREERSHRGPRQRKQAEGRSPELSAQDGRTKCPEPFRGHVRNTAKGLDFLELRGSGGPITSCVEKGKQAQTARGPSSPVPGLPSMHLPILSPQACPASYKFKAGLVTFCFNYLDDFSL